MEILAKILGWTIAIAAAAFVTASVVLFIRDGIASKREGRRRKTEYTAMFIVSMVLVGLLALIGILLCILALLIMRSM